MRCTSRSMLILLALVAVGCGGGGGDGEVAGSFGLQRAPYMSIGVGSHNPANFDAFAGPSDALDDTRWRFDFAHRVFANPDFGIFDATYELGEDGAVRFITEEARPEGDGGFDAEGDYGVFAGHKAFDGPQMFAHVRQKLLADVSEVDGAYHFVSLGRSALGPVSVTARARLLGGLMALTDGIVNSAGTVSLLVPEDVTTQRNVQGDLEIDPAGVNLVGGPSMDGNLILAGGGGELPSGLPQIQMLVRESTSASPATLRGAYWIVGMGGGNPWVSATGIAELDGDRHGDVVWRFTDGVTTDEDTFHVTYEVAADGEFVINMPFVSPAPKLRGGVTSDGRVAVAAGSVDPNGEPILIVLVRKK